MNKFMLNNPVQYIYGENSFEQLGEISSTCGKKALIVTYGQDHFIKLANRATELLKKENILSVVFSKVEANPTTLSAVEGAKIASENACDFLIGIGGGSALDTTKGISHCIKHGGENITEYMYGKKVGSETVPFILIPTTAGTGSEGNNFAVFTNPENHDKKGLVSTALYAKYSILDPTLLSSLPPHVVAGPGLDALFHCIEAYTSRSCTPVIEVYTLQAIKLIGENLRKMYRDSSNKEACMQMQIAALLGGISIGMAGVGIPHAVDHPIGGLYNVVHSEGLAALYPVCMKFIANSCPQKFGRIAEALGKNIQGLNLSEQAKLGQSAVIELINDVGMNRTFTDLKVKKEDLEWIINNTQTMMGIALKNSIKVPSKEELLAILLKSF